jgi:tryptophanyl-tRNA synthetase
MTQAQLIDDGTRFSTATVTAAVRASLSKINHRIPLQQADLILAVSNQLDYEVTNALFITDILLYDADLVPVGEDQKQHLELARDIAQKRINSRFGTEEAPVLKVPEPMILKEGARVMSLTDGRSKMSKSDPNEGSRINLLDPPELITKKIKRAKTDPQMGLEFGNPERPETDNLLGLYALLSGQAREAVAAECADMGWGRFKPLLAEAAVAALQPVQERYAELSSDPAELDRVLARGRQRASEVAEATLARTKAALGFLGAA